MVLGAWAMNRKLQPVMSRVRRDWWLGAWAMSRKFQRARWPNPSKNQSISEKQGQNAMTVFLNDQQSGRRRDVMRQCRSNPISPDLDGRTM